ncbi:hypothetical protein BX616_002778 [Lobosporangium transversale]|uniref:Uncharacterized protein n=1 Tax=Lobosporangium transversale TaxID=64571 RepID=A0A1Y2G7H9_9FUNG|nr:hypothetical protein BCR41DRAFT_417001 [Lobosporangium transversale]XP_021875193.1 hypothetical protein BCR41DRAFT_402489 [Lobosporangium transversale]KAF9899935.1 hypothetical protein BX616_002778 [Lobosporangium transversale]ORY93691.1 hypothetical protein BCR41DRAFT_417001 [Lobosporangium transversale]ORY93698.1 hypothetical protein BCR41DRAFT_402489 [Lobosporangium transversale]|eukprot:XP_021875186.1 hypothetical protein BCR41DRAFT_417001 [Lobosporangium transversale]
MPGLFRILTALALGLAPLVQGQGQSSVPALGAPVAEIFHGATASAATAPVRELAAGVAPTILSFFEHFNYRGECFSCGWPPYGKCVRITPGNKKSVASGIVIQQMDTRKGYTSVTFYEGDSCNGTYFRNSGEWQDEIIAYATLADFNDKIKSYVINDSELEPGVGVKPDPDKDPLTEICTTDYCYHP